MERMKQDYEKRLAEMRSSGASSMAEELRQQKEEYERELAQLRSKH